MTVLLKVVFTRAKDVDRSGEKIAVLLVEDHPLIRLALKRILANQSDLFVCGEACDSVTALELVKQHNPKLVILDLMFDGEMAGLNLIAPMREIDPAIKVLILSAHDEWLYAERSLRAGASGYVSKSEDPSVMLQAIRGILAGKIHLSETISDPLFKRLSKQELVHAASEADRLSNRERTVFAMIGSGKTSREIAEKLSISMKTVDVYRQRIKQKLGLDGRGDLARRAVEWVLSQKP